MLGAGQALVLGRFDPAWKDRYLCDRVTMGKPMREAVTIRAQQARLADIEEDGRKGVERVKGIEPSS